MSTWILYIYILCACIWGNKDIAMVDMKCMTINSNLNAVDVSNYSTVCVQSDDKYTVFYVIEPCAFIEVFLFQNVHKLSLHISCGVTPVTTKRLVR